MSKVKICGMSRLPDMEAVNEEKADYIGFVFAKSRRQVTPCQAFELREKLHPNIIPVGVFMNETPENILSLVRNGVIDMIQLHGLEDETYIRALKVLTNKPVIKAIAIQNKNDVQAWSKTSADFLLLDSKNAGSGKRFDWSMIGEIGRPYFLAGGLCPGNVREAVQKNAPFAVDVSSGVETDGMKDPIKIREFIRGVRNG